MAKKILLDISPGVIDALVLAIALFDENVEVVGVTSSEGNVPAEVAARNLQALVTYLDPPRLPRLGFGSECDGGLPLDRRNLFGEEGFGGVKFPVTRLRSSYPAEKLIAEIVREYPDEITIISLGALTNIARAFARDADLATRVRHLFMCGGAVHVGGDITPAAEFNIFADPVSARQVFHSVCTKTLLPLDVTQNVALTLGHIQLLPDEKFATENTSFGKLLREMLLPTLAAYRQELGRETIPIPQLAAYFTATNPEPPVTRVMAGDVELEGIITRGATIFDQREQPLWRKNMEVAIRIATDDIPQRTIESLTNIATIVDER